MSEEPYRLASIMGDTALLELDKAEEDVAESQFVTTVPIVWNMPDQSPVISKNMYAFAVALREEEASNRLRRVEIVQHHEVDIVQVRLTGFGWLLQGDLNDPQVL